MVVAGYFLGGVVNAGQSGYCFLVYIRLGFVCVFTVLLYVTEGHGESLTSRLLVYAVGWGLLHCGFAVGGFVGGAVAHVVRPGNAAFFVACLVVIALLAVGVVYAGPVRRGLRWTEPTGGAERMPDGGTETLGASCASVGAAHGLTQRETEVFELLAQGRDTRYIESALCIAGNTVKMHRKLDVHSQQELIDLVRGRSVLHAECTSACAGCGAGPNKPAGRHRCRALDMVRGSCIRRGLSRRAIGPSPGDLWSPDARPPTRGRFLARMNGNQ